MKVAQYTAPSSLADALAALAEGTDARPLAGGSSLLVEPSRATLDGARLVDLAKIPELTGIRSVDDGLWIGAMTTLAEIADNKAVDEQHPALAEATRSVGDAQVRNRGTLGGNLADPDPGTDLPAAILALGAKIAVEGRDGKRDIGDADVGAGTLRSVLKPGELIVGVTLPEAKGAGSAYEKFKHPATLYAVCGVAARVTLGADGAVAACAVAVTGATVAPTRLRGVEGALRGKQPDAAAIQAAAALASEAVGFTGDRFASVEYRKHLTSVLARRALARAVERARG